MHADTRLRACKQEMHLLQTCCCSMHCADPAELLCERLHVACFAAEAVVTFGHCFDVVSSGCHVRIVPVAARACMHGQLQVPLCCRSPIVQLLWQQHRRRRGTAASRPPCPAPPLKLWSRRNRKSGRCISQRRSWRSSSGLQAELP